MLKFQSTLLFTFSLLANLCFSQGLEKPVPLDPTLKIGTLTNGMTYYIKENGYPEDKVELRLVVNAGSMQEDESQLGMAHFVEHMAFNGSENFEKNDLVSFLQSIGVQFGADLNAYTSFEETVYILPIPTDNDTLLDQGLTVLKDWASGLSFDPEEIDKERGVVLEEWRLGKGAQQRMRDEYWPVLFKDSRYAERLPIGTKESIENTSHTDIQRFYEEWYRPELMAIVVVGDIDGDEMLKELEDRFSSITAKRPAKQKVSNIVPNHKETLVAITKDPENSFTAVQVLYKQPPAPEKTLSDFRQSYMRLLYNSMVNSRLQELTQQAAPPFIFGSSSYTSLVRSTDAYYSFAVAAEGEIGKALETLVIENERVKRFGFQPTELARAKENVLTDLQNYAKEKDKTESATYTSEYVNHFLSGSPSPGIDFELSFFEEIKDQISVEDINTLAKQWVQDENRVVIVTGVDKEGVVLPQESEIVDILDNLNLEGIAPYEDQVTDAPLIEDIPMGGNVVDRKSFDEIAVEEITLSNGLKLVLKETDFKNDEILMSAFSPGGHSLHSDEEFQSAKMAARIIDQSGVGNFSLIELQKLLTGKNVEISPYINATREGFSGNTTPEDLETLLQLTHLYFTAPRRDTAAFQSLIGRNKAFFKNLLANPQYFYQDRVERILSQNHYRGGGIPKPEEMDQVQMNQAFAVYDERFASADDFTFFFVGNLNMEQSIPLFEKYLGSLPANSVKEKWNDRGIRPPSGKVEEKVFRGTDEKSMVTIVFAGDDHLKKKDYYTFGALGDILSNRFIEILRENESSVYTVNVSAYTSKIPRNQYRLSVTFPCSPDNVDKLTSLVYEEIEKIQENGVEANEIEKIQEADLQNRKENLKRNDFWLGQLVNYYYNEADLAGFYDYETFVKNLSSEDLKQVAAQYVDLDSPIRISLFPEGYVED